MKLCFLASRRTSPNEIRISPFQLDALHIHFACWLAVSEYITGAAAMRIEINHYYRSLGLRPFWRDCNVGGALAVLSIDPSGYVSLVAAPNGLDGSDPGKLQFVMPSSYTVEQYDRLLELVTPLLYNIAAGSRVGFDSEGKPQRWISTQKAQAARQRLEDVLFTALLHQNPPGLGGGQDQAAGETPSAVVSRVPA